MTLEQVKEEMRVKVDDLREKMLEFYDRIHHLAFWKEGKCAEQLKEMNDLFQGTAGKPEPMFDQMIAINHEFQIRKEFYEEGVKTGQI